MELVPISCSWWSLWLLWLCLCMEPQCSLISWHCPIVCVIRVAFWFPICTPVLCVISKPLATQWTSFQHRKILNLAIYTCWEKLGTVHQMCLRTFNHWWQPAEDLQSLSHGYCHGLYWPCVSGGRLFLPAPTCSCDSALVLFPVRTPANIIAESIQIMTLLPLTRLYNFS